MDQHQLPPESVPLLTEGHQPQRQVKTEVKRSKLLTVCPFILGNEFCERLAYYGLATNLVTYLTHIMGVDAAAAAVQVMVFEGTCYVTPLLGAYLADSFWGRYRTILVFSSIYFVGCVLLTATSGLPGLTPGPYDDATWVQKGALVGALAVIALGTGGIKPNVSAFGADQFDEKDPQDKREKESFFNWFYLAINIGSLIACTVIVYVQDTVSWTLGFALPASAMATAVLLFLAGSKHYRHVAPTESPMARVVKVVTAALHNRWNSRRNKPAAPAAAAAVVNGASTGMQQDKFWGQAAGPTQPLLISGSPAPRGVGVASSSGGGGGGSVGDPVGSASSNSILGSSPNRVAFYQRQQQQQQQSYPTVYGFSPELPGQWDGQAGSIGSSSSLSRPPRPLGGGSSSSPVAPSPTLTPQQQHLQQQLGLGAGQGGAGAAGAKRTGSFSWLESAVVEWQVAQGHQLPRGGGGGQQQQQQQQLSRMGRGGTSSGVGGYSPQQVEEVKMVLRLLPVFTTTVIYWTAYSMMGTMFIQQGSLMDNSVSLPAWLGGGDGCGSSSSSSGLCLHIPAATMALFNTGAIILLVPVYDALVEPALKAAGVKWTLLRRIGWGMVIAVAAMFYAAVVERWRLDIYAGMTDGAAANSDGGGGGGGGGGGYGPAVVPLSIMWQAPAYVLVGASEVLASIAQLEFFYDQTVEHVTLVQVQDEEEGGEEGTHPGLPPRAPTTAPRAARGAIAINASAARRSQYHYAARDEGEEEGALYSRSLAFVPASPALPAPFR